MSQVAFFHEVPEMSSLMGAASMLLSVILMAASNCREEVKHLEEHPADGDASVRSLASMATRPQVVVMMAASGNVINMVIFMVVS